MGPEFGLQRATWTQGIMVQDPSTSEGGDCEDYAPNDPRRKERSACILTRPDCYMPCEESRED